MRRGYPFGMHQRPYEKLIVWKEAYSLCLSVYRLTLNFPSHERFGLVSQMRRASSSVPLNITEGNTKRSNREKIRFIDIALGSLEELHCASRLSRDLDYLTSENFLDINRSTHRVSYLLTRLRLSLASLSLDS